MALMCCTPPPSGCHPYLSPLVKSTLILPRNQNSITATPLLWPRTWPQQSITKISWCGLLNILGIYLCTITDTHIKILSSLISRLQVLFLPRSSQLTCPSPTACTSVHRHYSSHCLPVVGKIHFSWLVFWLRIQPHLFQKSRPEVNFSTHYLSLCCMSFLLGSGFASHPPFLGWETRICLENRTAELVKSLILAP